MKRFIQLFSLLLVLSGTVSASILPEDVDSEKSKSYSKSYPVGSGDKILLDNSFGEMKISTWSKNEIKVDISMTVKAGTDERAQKILDIITIEDGKNGSEIFFKTHLSNDKRNRDEDRNERHESTSFKINYTVYLPANATLEATNQFGPMLIGDFDGVATLTSKFGSLTAGKLSQPKKISVEFGKATIESMTNGKLKVQFSRAQVNKLSGEVTADFEQSQGIKINLDNSLKKLDINNSFSHVYLDTDKNLSASFTLKNSFGDFTNNTDFPITKNQENENRYFSKNSTYSGKAGSGTIPVSIKSSFGHVTIGHNISFDVNEKSSKDKAVKKIKV